MRSHYDFAHSDQLKWSKKEIKNEQGEACYEITVGRPFTFVTDMYLEFRAKKRFGKLKTTMSLWLHSQFIENDYVKLDKSQVDKASKNKDLKPFNMELYFRPQMKRTLDPDVIPGKPVMQTQEERVNSKRIKKHTRGFSNFVFE
jgi:hypothetical protein